MHYQFAKNHSIRISKLNEINNNPNYRFYPYVNPNMRTSYDNKNFFNDISTKDYLTYELQFKSREIIKNIGLMEYNNDLYQNKYIKDVNSITDKYSYNKGSGILIKGLINSFEDKIFKKIIKNPVRVYYINVTLTLTNINGYGLESKSNTFYSKDIKELITRLNNKNGDFYRDREIWNSICRVERGKVTNKIRFMIYNRDHYRCQMCKRTFDKSILEIDHIRPIAKGGKSNIENLQTLCHNCNVKKGDSYNF